MMSKVNVKEVQRRKNMWILIVAAVVLELISGVQYFFSHEGIRREAEQRARTELHRAELEIEKHTIEMETAAKALAMLAERHVNNPDSVFAATRSIVHTIENTSSVAVAYIPNYFPKRGKYFESCSSRISQDSIYTRQIGSESHDYTQMEWFQNGLKIDSCWWCEPYLDDSGSQTWVVSCSCPVHNSRGEVVAVVCVDLSLDYLKDLSDYLQIYKESHYSIRSSKGTDIVLPPDTVAGRKYEIFDEEIDATGWQISIIIPNDVIYAELRRASLVINILMVIGLAVLLFILYRSGKSLNKLRELGSQQERIENELNIARDIQMTMLPTRFPPFEDYPELEAYGEVIPAKEVGGDLFDFYIRENKLYFCIGDVSGKGVPASIVMAMTRSLFHSFTSYLSDPAQIVMQMNNSLSDDRNEQNMFVTLFLGILDLTTGEMQYCNAGHDAPVYIGEQPSKADYLPVHPNLPLGVLADFAFTAQTTQLNTGDTLFLYTDGLTEAENAAHELFGSERIIEVIHALPANTASRKSIEIMADSVHSFVQEAPQSDDLTMFVIRFLDKHVVAAKQQTEKEYYSLTMRNDIQQIPTLAEWVESLGIPAELDMPVNLALEEAVTNVMLYAYPENQTGSVLIEATKESGKITFVISDSGIAFDPTKKEEADVSLSAEDREIGGLGIHLVRKLMDNITYQRKDGRNILTLVKNL